MALALVYAHGATPLDPDEAAALVPASVATTGELNAYEAENILLAVAWLARTRRREVLDDTFLRELHRRMFGRTWTWAGRYRQTGKNLGVDPLRVAIAVRELVLDCKAQVAASAMDLDEIAARFHHRLVWVHPFANGNGRHARLAADCLLEQHGRAPFSWGAANLAHDGPVRAAYIDALRAADRGVFAPLLAFVRS